MALFHHADADAILEQFRHQHHALGRALGCAESAAEPPDAAGSPLHRDLMRLIGVANGAYDRTDTNVRRAELALQRVTTLLRAGAPTPEAVLSAEFWSTTLGVLMARTRWWVSVDDLITISNAAALAFGDNTQANRMKITRAVERGELEWVPDPSMANPQHNTRVLRSQVERLRLLRGHSESKR